MSPLGVFWFRHEVCYDSERQGRIVRVATRVFPVSPLRTVFAGNEIKYISAPNLAVNDVVSQKIFAESPRIYHDSFHGSGVG
ncbi:hypothetical protein D3C80_1547640 [compost metagenome]